MSQIDRPEQGHGASTASDFSLTNFFHDAYNKGVVTAVEERPREAAVTVVGAAAAAAAAVCLGRSGLVSGLFRSGATEEAGQLMMPAGKAFVTEGAPLRFAAADLGGGRTLALSTEAPLGSTQLSHTISADSLRSLDQLTAHNPATRFGFGAKLPAFDTTMQAPVLSGNIEANGVMHTTFAPGASNEVKAQAIMDSAFGHPSGDGVMHMTFAPDATAEEKAAAIMDSAAGHAPGGSSAFSAYDEGNYKFVPARNLASDIRMANGPTMTSVKGPSEIIFGENNAIQHVRFNHMATDVEKADLLMKAGYAGLIQSDSLAYKAAGKVAGQSIGFISQPVERFATMEELQQNAIKGASAYVDGNAAGANKYTEYLTERYGPMTRDSQTWGRHIMTDASSPESPWNPNMAPATDALMQHGLPISPVNRAVAANASVLKAQPWMRGAAIRGGVEYMQARADETFAGGAKALVTDVWYGTQAKEMTPEVVNTIGAITLSMGEKACANVTLIDKVAELVGAHGRPEDYVGAYNALKQGQTIMASMMR